MDETVKKTASPFEVMKTIVLPRATAGEEKSVYVGVNGRTWQVPRGKPVEVPEPVYDRLMIMLKAQAADDDFRAEVEEDARKMGML